MAIPPSAGGSPGSGVADGVQIREYSPGDREAVKALAPRLTEGVATWRDPAAVLAAVQGWIG